MYSWPDHNLYCMQTRPEKKKTCNGGCFLRWPMSIKKGHLEAEPGDLDGAFALLAPGLQIWVVQLW